MTEHQPMEIPLSKAKLAKLLLFSLLFLAAGLWFITTNPQVSNPVFNSPVVKALAFYGAAIMGALGIFFFSRKLLDKKPGLIVNEEGIYDNTSAFHFGLIPWCDIAGIHESAVQAGLASRQRFLTIALADPGKYIAREKNLLKRKLLQANARHYGSPVHISTNGLATDHHRLLDVVRAYYEKYKPATVVGG